MEDIMKVKHLMKLWMVKEYYIFLMEQQNMMVYFIKDNFMMLEY